MRLLSYSRNTAESEDISSHLLACNSSFVPPLSLKVDLNKYSKKLFDYAVNFEAWYDGRLVGLVSAYVNDVDKCQAFISNVSILGDFKKKGIATTLLHQCIEYTKEHMFEAISLEVSLKNKPALDLYLKSGFVEVERGDEMVSLTLFLKHNKT